MVDTYIPDYGDIVWLFLDSTLGHEQAGRRPALVISVKEFAQRTNMAIACPITSNPKGLPFEVQLRDCSTVGAVLPIHVRNLDYIARKLKFIEKAPVSITDAVSQSIGAITSLN